jgi:general secretion pathway protein K
VPQRGVILLSMLVLVALAAVIAAALFFDTGIAARRAANAFGMEEALQIGAGAEALAAYGLADDKNQTDTPQDSWATPITPLDVQTGVTVEGQLYDLQGRFNLNSLVKADGSPDENTGKVFARILELLQLERRWADLIVDWIDPDVQAESEGGEDSLYMSQQPPHLVGNLPLTSTSELLQLPGFTQAMYRKLVPHITALPPSVRTVNVCMADGVVLDALFALKPNDSKHVEYSSLTAQELEERRGQDCFPRRSILGTDSPAIQAVTTERTAWFCLQTRVLVGTAQFDLYSLIYRGTGQARAVMRGFGIECRTLGQDGDK